MRKTTERKVYGYWANNKNEAIEAEFPMGDSSVQYPWPEIAVEPWSGKEEFLKLLELAEAKCFTVGYRGSSKSRLTGETLGSREVNFHDTEQDILFCWPEDYGKHYIAKGVLPPRSFVLLIFKILELHYNTNMGMLQISKVVDVKSMLNNPDN